MGLVKPALKPINVKLALQVTLMVTQSVLVVTVMNMSTVMNAKSVVQAVFRANRQRFLVQFVVNASATLDFNKMGHVNASLVFTKTKN